MKHSKFNETMSSMVNDALAQVSNNSEKCNFSVYKPYWNIVRKATSLYKSVAWLTSEDDEEEIELNPTFRACIMHVIDEAHNRIYGLEAFKNDLALQMSLLLNNRKFVESCWKDSTSIFLSAQVAALTTDQELISLYKSRHSNSKKPKRIEPMFKSAFAFDELVDYLHNFNVKDDVFKGDIFTSVDDD